MFSLIITLVVIALVILLALATVYYGGSAMREGRAQAEASTVLAEGQQISAAMTLYRQSRGSYPSGSSDDYAAALIADGYLRALPSGVGTWSFINDHATVVGLTDDACLALNVKNGMASTPQCSAVTPEMGTVCCSE